jgi:phage shock protein C
MTNTKKLYRTRRDRVIAGVCGGLAEYFNIDVWIIRIIFIGLAFVHGAALIAYIILSIVIPEKPSDQPEVITTDERQGSIWLTDKKNILAVILICTGTIFLLKQTLPWPWLDGRYVWPAALIIIGIFFIIKKK